MSAPGDGNLSVHSARLLSSAISLIAAELRLHVERARPRALRLLTGVIALAIGMGFAALSVLLAALSPLLLQWSSFERLVTSIAISAGLSLVGFLGALWAWKRARVAVERESANSSGWRALSGELASVGESSRGGAQP